MSYFVRAFCTAPDVPPLSELIAWVATEKGITLAVYDRDGATPLDLTSPDWHDAELLYKEGHLPIPCEVERDDGSPDGVFKAEVGAFLKLLEDTEDTPERARIEAHLRASRFVVTNQLLSDVDDAGYAASEAILDYFVQLKGGLLQADGGGFYEGDELIVEVG